MVESITNRLRKESSRKLIFQLRAICSLPLRVTDVRSPTNDLEYPHGGRLHRKTLLAQFVREQVGLSSLEVVWGLLEREVTDGSQRSAPQRKPQGLLQYSAVGLRAMGMKKGGKLLASKIPETPNGPPLQTWSTRTESFTTTVTNRERRWAMLEL